MTSRRRQDAELAASLEALRRADVPDHDPLWAAELEARLLDEADTAWRVRQGRTNGPRAARKSGAGRRPRRAPFRPVGGLGAAAAGLAAVVLAAIVAAAGVTGLLDRREALRVAAGNEAELVLPDGRVVPAAPGLTLPDGTVIRTGPDGSATVAGLTLGPGQSAVVEDGQLRALGPPLSPTSSPVRPAEPAPLGPAPSSTTTPAGAPPNTPPATRPPTATVPPGPADMRLAVSRAADGAYLLSWSAVAAPGFDRYLLLRATGGAEPDYPPGGATTVIADTRDTRGADGARPAARPAWRVVAVTAAGRLLARSPVVRP